MGDEAMSEHLTILVDPARLPYEAIARAEATSLLQREARRRGWQTCQFGFCKDTADGYWRG